MEIKFLNAQDWGVYIQPVLATWISPKQKVTLIGDAAHATSPFMGQGANMAIMDAWRLGRCCWAVVKVF